MATAALIVGGIGVIGSVIGAGKQADAATEAARIQATAAEKGQELVAQQFGATKETLDPFIQGAGGAFERQQAFAGGLGAEAQAQAFSEFQESPNVAFLREQGLRGIDQQASARGGLGGGERLKALTQFSQGLALQDFNNQFNRLGAVTGTGLGAAQSLAGAGANQAAQQANLLSQGGRAQAQGVTGRSQAFQSGLRGVGQALGTAIGGFNPQVNLQERQ